MPLLLPTLKEAGVEHAANKDFLVNKAMEYTDAWSEKGEVILMAMCDILNLEFNQNIIDAYVLPFSNSFSDPMIISTKYTPNRFIEVFTHELTHRLLTDNTKLGTVGDKKLLPHWEQLFGNEYSFVALVHIPVHALIKYIFLDVLHEPERLEHDIELCKKSPDYTLAWEYVQAHDYKDIITKLKEQYDSF